MKTFGINVISTQVEESVYEIMLEDLINETIIDPELEEDVKELAIETLDKYSDKKRKREIKEVPIN